MSKEYFVSFSHSLGGFGNGIFNMNVKFDAKEVAEFMEKEKSITNVVVLYYREINEKE
jgi:hypothetical protein